LKNLEELLHRGVRQFKFVDRTFNLNLATSKTLLQFFLDHQQPGLFVHFEMIPDRLPEPLREIIGPLSAVRCNLKSASKPSIPTSPNSSAAARITTASRTISNFSGPTPASTSTPT